MSVFPADLHIHTALSPCAADEMTPPAIVRTALERGLAMIAICDHNSAGNTAATQAAAARAGDLIPRRAAQGPVVIPGIEITTAEEVHVVGLFPTPEAAGAVANEVQQTLPKADATYYERFGDQRLMNADGTIVGQEPRMLAGASALHLSAAVAMIHRHDGLAIAAHVNRPSFSVLSQLGVFPEDTGFDAVEVFVPRGPAVPALSDAEGSAVGPYGKRALPVIAASDAHFLTEIGASRTLFHIEAPTFDELVLALRGAGGRGVRRA